VSLHLIPADDRVLALEDAVDGVFAVHDVATHSGGKVIVLRGQFLRSPEMVYEAVVGPFRSQGFIPLLRQEDGQDLVIAYPAPRAGGKSRPAVHLLLLAATVLSTLLAGTLQAVAGELGEVHSFWGLMAVFMTNWTAGIPFTVALLGILGVHELGHYFVARRYGLNVSLPYFIPFPFNPLTGTLGAVIRIQSPFESRRDLFDVGIAGPLAGLVVALPVVALGLMQATVAPLPAGAQVIGEPLLFRFMAYLIVGERAAGTDISMNPLLMAGWWGFFITALNLLPISQLDGGHIAYALFGSAHRYFAWAVFGLAAAVALLVSPQYILMLSLVFLLGIEHPPALNDLTPIGTPRRVLGLLTLLLFPLLFTINPFQQLG
jgi:membrane-associated protease RseP (regulator of RpoE activity)